jgi:hypothetical protein
MGVDLLYEKMETANKDAWQAYSPSATSNIARPTGTYKWEDQDALAFRFRVQRNIVP